MRKFTDRYMKVPIRMYKADDVEDHINKRELIGVGDDDIDYAVGYVKIFPYDILEWHDSFSRPRTIEEVKTEGFDSTRLEMRSGNSYDCMWARREFESRANDFVAKYEEDMDKDSEELIISLENRVKEDPKL